MTPLRAWMALTLALATLPLAAAGQVGNLRPGLGGEPAGIAVPGLSVAGAEEPTAVELNPAGVGFTGGPALHYLHQGRGGGKGADGFWAALPVGPLVPSLSMQWVRPGEAGGPHFRKTTWGLALSGGSTFALGLGWNAYSSPDPGLGAPSSFDLGVSARPWRHLGLGLALRGLDARLSGQRLPLHIDLGAATRIWDDRLTLSADLLSNDQGRGDLQVDAAALGATVALPGGLGLRAQVALPVKGGRGGAAGAAQALLALTFDTGHLGLLAGGAAGEGVDRTWLAGARLSTERYRGATAHGALVPLLDLQALLSPRRSFLAASERDPYGALLRRLAQARADPAVAALAIRVDALPLGMARVEELRDLLLSVKAVKPVAVLLVGGGLRELELASAASVVLAVPSASFFPLGLSSTTPFLAEGLGKLGVAFDVVAAGAYKSAPEPLVRRDMSPAQREATESLLDDLYARRVAHLALARRLPEQKVRAVVETGVLSAAEAVDLGLVDGLAWPDELDKALGRLVGRTVRSTSGWSPARPRAAERWGARPAVALLRVEGTIAQGRSRSVLGGGRVAGAETVGELIRRAVDDARVRALVVRVDSPGGDALASDLLWRELALAQRAGKPVVVSMGDLAASGGYLLAAGADCIVAEPSTLTGSIGAFVVKPDLSGLLTKLGVNVVTLKRGERADLESPARPWSPEERARVETELKAFYATFLGRVAEGRRLTRAAVEEAAGGRVWTGAQAKARGLVDRLGSLEEALRVAQERAGLLGEEPELLALEPDQDLLERLPLGPLAGAQAPGALEAWAARVPEVRAAALLVELGPVLALPPAWLVGPDQGLAP